MKVSKLLKRLFSIFFILIFLLVIAAIAIPYFFKDDLLAMVKEEANKNLNAEVDFSDVDLSLLRSFPNLSFNLNNLEVKGIEDFAGTNLLAASDLGFTLDLMSVIKKDRPIEIKSVEMNNVEMNVMVLSNEKANYKIVKESEEASSNNREAYNYLIQLEKYELNNFNLTYEDRTGDVFVEIKNLNHNGSGDITQDVFNLDTKTKIGHLTARADGINYLKKAKINVDAILDIDVPNNKYTLKENTVSLNAMKVLCEGWVQIPDGDGIDIDFSFDAPQNNFKNLLSLIPGAYTKDFNGVEADGKMGFSGNVKGTYSGTKNIFPAFNVNLDIDNGKFKYPDLPKGMNSIFADVKIASPSTDLDQLKIDIPNFKLNLDNEPFEGRFKLRTPISDPDVDARLKGKINLAELNKAFPLDGVTELSGILNTNMVVKTRMSTIDKGDYENVNMEGAASLEQFTYKADGLPKIKINDTQVDLTPRHVIIKDFSGKLGRSDIRASGKIDNILAYFSPTKSMTGDLKVRSNFFDSNEWISDEEATASDNIVVTNEESTTEIFDRFKFNFDAQIGTLTYDVYELKNATAIGSFSPNSLKFNDFETKIYNSDLRGKGKITNVFGFVFNNEVLGGDLDLVSNFFDLNKFMEASDGTPTAKKIANTEEVYEAIIIPENVDINIDAKIKKALYTDINLKDVTGKIKIKDAAIKADEVKGSTLGGRFKAEGTYDTKDANKPMYDLSYDISKFDFKQSFKYLNSFKAAMPIAEFISGSFSTKMNVNGELGKDMMPKLDAITADGFLQTVNGFVSDFKPLNDLGEKLNIKYLKDHKIDLKGTKNWFQIENGFVNVKEFPLDYKGIDMKINGKHSFSHEMDYDIKAKIPTKLIGKGGVGAKAQTGLKFLNEQASKIGVDLNVGEFVNVLINMTGSMTNPKFKIKLLSSEGEAASVKEVITNAVETVVDSVKTEVKEVVDNTKAIAKAKAEAEIKKLNDKAELQIKKLMDEAHNKANLAKREGRKAAEKVRQEGYKQADAIVKKAGNNIFKKKAAEIAAEKLKKETDKKVDRLILESDKKSQQFVTVAERKSDDIRKRTKQQAEKIRKKYE